MVIFNVNHDRLKNYLGASSGRGARPRGLQAAKFRGRMRAVIHHSIEAIDFGINSGIEAEKTARFARRMGYRGVGENLVKEMAAIPASGG